MNKKIGIVATIAIIAVMMVSTAASAQNVKDRMRDRLPEIQALKAKGAIGENNQGYLEIRGKNGAAKTIVAAENKDRQSVYQAIAKKTNTTAQLVGQRRAIQIAKKAGAGEWLQDPSGKWYQK